MNTIATVVWILFGTLLYGIGAVGAHSLFTLLFDDDQDDMPLILAMIWPMAVMVNGLDVLAYLFSQPGRGEGE